MHSLLILNNFKLLNPLGSVRLLINCVIVSVIELGVLVYFNCENGESGLATKKNWTIFFF